MTQPMEYDPERHDPPVVLNVHHAALQEIDKVVGNELTLDEEDTTRLRGIIFAALSPEHTRCPGRVVAYADGRTGRCMKGPAGHPGDCA